MKATGKTCGGNDGCGKPKRQGFPQPWKSLRDSHIPTARLLLYIFPKPIPKGVFLTACTFSLQAHSSIRKDSCRGPWCSCSKIMSPHNCNETLSPCKDGDHESERVPTGESD